MQTALGCAAVQCVLQIWSGSSLEVKLGCRTQLRAVMNNARTFYQIRHSYASTRAEALSCLCSCWTGATNASIFFGPCFICIISSKIAEGGARPDQQQLPDFAEGTLLASAYAVTVPRQPSGQAQLAQPMCWLATLHCVQPLHTLPWGSVYCKCVSLGQHLHMVPLPITGMPSALAGKACCHGQCRMLNEFEPCIHAVVHLYIWQAAEIHLPTCKLRITQLSSWS